MMIRGSITTQRHTARLTGAQVNPLITDLHALFTFVTLRMLDRLDRLDMSTSNVIVHNANILPQNRLSHKAAQMTQVCSCSSSTQADSSHRHHKNSGNGVSNLRTQPLENQVSRHV